MGLFDKKFCDICGDKIGLLGNRKLEDGNMCKNCAKKLSPFFSDRKSSTIDEIKQQLAYREQNKGVLATFSPTFNFGDYDKIYIDPMKASFVVSRRSPGAWSDENPDVVPISSVVSCNLRIDEDKDELYTQNSNGDRVSYNPPRYNFYYNFYIDINVNTPYFNEITVNLNNSRVEGMGTMEYHRYQQMGQQIIDNLTQGRNGAMNMNQNYAQQPNAYGQQPVAYAQQPVAYGQQPVAYAQQPNAYGQQPVAYTQQPNAYAQQPAAYTQQPAAPVSQAWICPNCNASNDGGNFCMSCGSKKN